MVGIRGDGELQSENLGKEVNATLHPRLGKNFLGQKRRFSLACGIRTVFRGKIYRTLLEKSPERSQLIAISTLWADADASRHTLSVPLLFRNPIPIESQQLDRALIESPPFSSAYFMMNGCRSPHVPSWSWGHRP
jgi:hypothetical protein